MANKNETIDVAFLGPPGSGKGTQSRRFAEHYRVCHIDAASLLRNLAASKGDGAKQVKALIDNGNLVDDSTVSKLVEEQLSSTECSRGAVLDGFPRTLAQAERLQVKLNSMQRSLKAVVQFDISDQLATERITGRLHHQPSGRVYHHLYQPPKQPGRDDVTGEALTKRTDDFPDVMPRRLAQFRKHCIPVLNLYNGMGIMRSVDASKQPDQVWERLRKMFG